MPERSSSPLFLAALLFGVLGGISIITAILALFQLKLLRSIFRTLIGLALLSLGFLAGTISLGMIGYRALTREVVAAHIVVQPTGPQRFTATIRYPDGRETKYEMAGDGIYVDAHVLKWHPWANTIGLHTAYELDRVAGRYHDVKDERSAPRTVHALARDKPVDLYALRRRHPFLAPVLDAEYGSATFVPVTRPAQFELRV